MERQSIVLISAIVGFLLIAGVLAYWFGGQPQIATESIEPIKKFRAKPGTQRENARALVSDIPSEDSGDSGASAGTEGGARSDDPVEVWGRLAPKEPGAEDGRGGIPRADLSGGVSHAIDLASHAADPAAGLRGLRASLEQAPSPDEAAALHLTAAQLLNRMGGEHVAERDAAFDAAIAAAESMEVKAVAVTQFANTYLIEGDGAKALDIAVSIDLEDAEFDPGIARLGVLTGIAMERQEMPEAAEEHFLWVLDEIEAQGRRSKSGYEKTYRQAALLLSRLYRSTDRAGEAARLKLRIELWLEE